MRIFFPRNAFHRLLEVLVQCYHRMDLQLCVTWCVRHFFPRICRRFSLPHRFVNQLKRSNNNNSNGLVSLSKASVNIPQQHWPWLKNKAKCDISTAVSTRRQVRDKIELPFSHRKSFVKRTVTICEDNIRRFSTKLKGCTFNHLRCFSANDLSDLSRASEGDLVHIGVSHDRTSAVWTITRQNIDHTLQDLNSCRNKSSAETPTGGKPASWINLAV